MDLPEFNEKLSLLTKRYEEEVATLSREYREANILLKIGDTITVDTEFLRKFIFQGDKIFKNNGVVTILRCTDIVPTRSYKTNLLTESVYVMEEFTLKGKKKKYSSPLRFDSIDIKELLANPKSSLT